MRPPIAEQYAATRKFTEYLCEPLDTEDFVVQSMPDASPVRWHLAHTTWFFETFVLLRWATDYRPHSADYQFLFNSYYNSVGEPFPRSERGLLTRPTVAQVLEYRRAVDEHMGRLLEVSDDAELARVVELGCHHEQQHQELILTDLKHMLSCNPLHPVYRPSVPAPEPAATGGGRWAISEGGMSAAGHGGSGFCFDNERPRHQVYFEPFELHEQLVSAGEFLEFIRDGGYRRPEFWLSLGWATVREHNWNAPLYWTEREDGWHHFTLSGLRPVDVHEPVTHVSYFEAEAFARWAGARLPTEFEWEHAACDVPTVGSFVEAGNFHPRSGQRIAALNGMFGEVWQWTQSSYAPFPGYVAPPGALGEYNGKFMCNQYVLRGGSCATAASHIRATYRNFFPPEARWQFSGIRLARDVPAKSH